MKSRFFLILAMIALVGFLVSIDYGNVCAQQEVPMAEELEEGKYAKNAEFSTLPDVDKNGNVDPQQIIYTEIPDGEGGPYPDNTFDFENPLDPDIDVDALADSTDALFGDLIANRVNLLVSFQGDTKGLWKVWQEDVAGNTRVMWSKTDFDYDDVVPNDRDLDALELWGKYGVDDANYYSLVGDTDLGMGRVSVYNMDHGPYISHAVIVAAVREITPDGYEGEDDVVDLDALMVWDTDEFGTWSNGDTIIFSIRDTRPAGNFDGGEIVVKPWGGPAFFLDHGIPPGQPVKLWNTAFNVAAAFGVDTDEVDAIEAFRGGSWPPAQTPTLTQWGLIILVALLVVSTVLVILRRRKAAVPA